MTERQKRERRGNGAAVNSALEAGHLPPQSPELEQAVLGACMIESAPITQISDLLKPEHFYVEAHVEIYRAILQQHAKGEPVNILTVTNRLRQNGKLEDIGGVYYISSLTNKVASSAHVEYHATLILQSFIGRELIRVGSSITNRAYDPTEDVFDLMDELAREQTDLYNIAKPRAMVPASEGIGALIDGSPSDHLTFGIESLDAKCVLEKGLVHTFAGRPGVGKSVLSCHIAWHVAKTYGPVLLFSPEMTVRQIQSRIVSMESGVPYKSILRRRLSEQEMADVTETIERIADQLAMVKIDPTDGITPLAVRARTERSLKLGGANAIIVDYIQKMTTGDKKIDSDDRMRVGRCSNGVTDLCKATNLPGIVLSQLNRDVEKRPDKRPKMSDLRDSGSLEQDAAMIGLLFREGYYQDNPPYEDDLIINVAKYRDGDVGLCTTKIIPALARISDTGLHEPRMAPKFDERRTGEKTDESF